MLTIHDYKVILSSYTEILKIEDELCELYKELEDIKRVFNAQQIVWVQRKGDVGEHRLDGGIEFR